jgi:hypothetical protein
MRSRDVVPLDFVIANFMQLEDQMIECMRYIPFIDRNRSVVSPKFIPILLESCTLVESIFGRLVADGKRHTLKSYSGLVERELDLACATTMVLAAPLQFLRPFRSWSVAPPAWWNAYNQVKHDRISNYDAASYALTINALAGLHQVIVRNSAFAESLTKVGWIDESHPNTSDLMLFRNVGCPPPEMPAESRLFVSPIRGDFADWGADSEADSPSISREWEFSWRVKFHIWDYEGW